MLNKIDLYGLGSRCFKLRELGNSFETIAKMLNDETSRGVRISRGAVERYLKAQKYDELHRLEDATRKLIEKFESSMRKNLTYQEKNYISKAQQEFLREIGSARAYINSLEEETTAIRNWMKDEIMGKWFNILEEHLDSEGKEKLKELVKKW